MFISIIIPVYNEEKYLKKQVSKLILELKKSKNISFELILIENGSGDRTYFLAKQLTKKYRNIRVFRLADPCYGLALKKGIISAKSDVIVEFDIDFIDTDFLKRSLSLIKNHDIVIGSKLHRESRDNRSVLRLAATRIVNMFIRRFFGYKGTDTHGIKAYRKNKIIPFLDKVRTTHHFFETELILRSEKNRLRIIEVPVRVAEIRPTRFPAALRGLLAVKELIMLYSIRNELKK